MACSEHKAMRFQKRLRLSFGRSAHFHATLSEIKIDFLNRLLQGGNMTIMLCPNVEELTWKEVQESVANSCTELYKILADINPGEKYTFIRVRYPFGSIIMHEDEVYFPFGKNNSIPLSDPAIPNSIKEKLGYRSIPFGMITANSVEIYRESSDRVFSVELSGPNKGLEIGIFEYFGLTPCYTVSSGARSLFMIPKISETRNHKKLMKYMQINCGQPRNIFKQWHVFKELYNSPIFDSAWEAEIVYLPKIWDDSLESYAKESLPWAALKSYLYKKGFEHSQSGRCKLLVDILWQEVAIALDEDGLKPDIYTVDTLKQLIHIYLGSISGNRPSINNYAGPIQRLQEVYVEQYGLEKAPTIMIPQRFKFSDNIPVYYSMQEPAISSSNPLNRKLQTIIEEMRELMAITSALSRSTRKIKLDNLKLHQLIQSMKLEFFHSDLYSYGKEIRPTTEIAQSDSDFLYTPSNPEGKLEFADNGSFIRGCIKISKSEIL